MTLKKCNEECKMDHMIVDFNDSNVHDIILSAVFKGKLFNVSNLKIIQMSVG